MNQVEAAAEEDNFIGQTLGGAYLVQSRLDAGSMGAVYRAEHVRLRRPVAVKVVAGHLVSDAQALGRFRQEAEIIAELSHPHIVEVLDFDMTPDHRPYLVMELLQGRPLHAVLEAESRLSINDSIQVVLQVASALTRAHGRGIVHRDLKPANLFMLDVEAKVFVKVLDFGIGKNQSGRQRLTGEFDVLGTPEYMAPEQALGRAASVDARGDQYSLGVILYEMLTGVVPHTGSDITEILLNVIHESPLPPSRMRPDIPTTLDEIVLRSLSKEPEDRFESIADFADELACFIESPQTSPPAHFELEPTSEVRFSASRLEEPDALLKLTFPAPGAVQLSPQQAFILSRIVGEVSVEELIDLSPFEREETLSQLSFLMNSGVIAFARSNAGRY